MLHKVQHPYEKSNEDITRTAGLEKHLQLCVDIRVVHGQMQKFFCRLERTQPHFVPFLCKHYHAKNYSNQMTFRGCSMA